jgi:hypothetical protein
VGGLLPLPIDHHFRRINVVAHPCAPLSVNNLPQSLRRHIRAHLKEKEKENEKENKRKKNLQLAGLWNYCASAGRKIKELLPSVIVLLCFLKLRFK